MAWAGKTFTFPVNGNWNCNYDLSSLKPDELSLTSRNVWTHNGGAEKRGGTAIVRDIGVDTACLGVGQMISATGSAYDYFVGVNGNIYRNGSSVASGLSTTARRVLTPYPGKMFICSGVDPVKVDTGAAIANITTAAADWSGSNQPTQIIIHNRNASRRGFGLGVPGKKNNVYYSVSGNLEDYAGAGSGLIVVDVQDGNGLVAGISWDENLLVFGREETFFIDDSSATASSWGNYRAAWKGGVYSPQLLVKAQNSVYCMMEDGDIYRVDRAAQLREYQLASITKPSYVHNYIRDYTDLSKIAKFHMAYDPVIKALKVFVVRTGQTTVDTALVYYLPTDDLPNGKWAPPSDSRESTVNSGFSAAESATFKISTGVVRLCTGDYHGKIHSLSNSAKADNSVGYKQFISTAATNCQLPRSKKLFVRALTDFTSAGNYSIKATPIVDLERGIEQEIGSTSLSRPLGTFVLGVDTLATIGAVETFSEIGLEGRLIRFEFYNDQSNQDFLLTGILVDLIDKGGLYS